MPAIRVEVSYENRKYFITEKRRKLDKYNQTNGTRIEKNKATTLRLTVETNLGLLLRKKITSIYGEFKKGAQGCM